MKNLPQNRTNFPEWLEVLNASNFHEKTKQSRIITIRWYLAWCKRSSQVVCRESGRHFLRTAGADKSPAAYVFESWCDALKWFFDSSEELINESSNAPSENEFEGWEREFVSRLRQEGKSYRTETTYLSWCRRMVDSSKVVDISEFDTRHLECFLSNLAVEAKRSIATQRQALNAGVFLLKNCLGKEVSESLEFERARAGKKLPVVLSRSEVSRLFEELDGNYLLMGKMQYSAGLRVSELLRLRVKDLDFDQGMLIVRQGKGKKDRSSLLSEAISEDLKKQLKRLKTLFEQDRAESLQGVYLPPSVEHKYPNAGKRWEWQWLWPSQRISKDPRGGEMRRHHVMHKG